MENSARPTTLSLPPGGARWSLDSCHSHLWGPRSLPLHLHLHPPSLHKLGSGCGLSLIQVLLLLSCPQVWGLNAPVSSWSQLSVHVHFHAFPSCDVSRPGLVEPGVWPSLSVHTLRIHSQFYSQLEGPWEADPPNLWTSDKLKGWEMAKDSSPWGVRKTQTQRAHKPWLLLPSEVPFQNAAKTPSCLLLVQSLTIKMDP